MSQGVRQRDESKWVNGFGLLLMGVALGAGGMFFLDPVSGRGRRARIGQKGTRAKNLTVHYGGKFGRHLRNRAIGLMARLRPEAFVKPDDNLTIRDRIRSEMGRKVRHPSAIEVAVVDGEVTLSGPVLAEEVGDLIATAIKVHGVKRIRNFLEVHQGAGNVPALQGEGKSYLREHKPGKVS